MTMKWKWKLLPDSDCLHINFILLPPHPAPPPLPPTSSSVRTLKNKPVHLHAERLSSSCEGEIEMEMGRRERADYSSTCAAPWLAHHLSGEREREEHGKEGGLSEGG